MHRDALERLAGALAREDDVTFAYLFGSEAEGEAGPLSDVDVGVFVRDPGSRDIELALIAIVTRALGRDDVDVVVLNRAPLTLAFEVLKGRLLVSKDEDARVMAEAAIMATYHDRAHYMRRHLAAAAERFAERGFA